MASPVYVPVDSWTLRCLYNRSDYSQRIEAGDFVELKRESSKPRANGVKSIQVYYGPPATRSFRVKLHWFEDTNGAILASRRKDPKQIYIPEHHADYHQHGGNLEADRLRRDPELRYRQLWARKLYGLFRRLWCRILGPTEARSALKSAP